MGLFQLYTITYLKAAREYVPLGCELYTSAELLRIDSLTAVFSDSLIFTACKITMDAISTTKTNNVKVFPFCIIYWI